MSHTITEGQPSNIRRLFIAALSFGVIAIFVGWYLERMQWTLTAWLLTLGVPVATMIIYIVIAHITDPDLLATDLFADSVYYLGFLFTLVALAVSLLTLTGRVTDTTGLVYRFGVALVTTIIGLAVRTYLVNFHRTVQDEFTELESQMMRSAENLRDRIDQFTREMTMQQAAFVASVAKLNEGVGEAVQTIRMAGSHFDQTVTTVGSDLGRAIEDTSETLRSSVDDASRKASDALDTTAEAIKSTASAIKTLNAGFETAARTSFEELRAVLEDSAGNIGTAMETLRTEIMSLHFPPDFLSRHLGEPVADLRKLVQSYNAQISAWLISNGQLGEQSKQLAAALSAAINAAQQATDKSLVTISSAENAIGSLAGRLSEAAAALESVSASYKAHETDVRSHTQSVGEMSRQVQNELEIARRHREELETQLTAARKAVGRVHEELTEAVVSIREELRT